MLWSYRYDRVGPMDIFLVEDLRTFPSWCRTAAGQASIASHLLRSAARGGAPPGPACSVPYQGKPRGSNRRCSFHAKSIVTGLRKSPFFAATANFESDVPYIIEACDVAGLGARPAPATDEYDYADPNHPNGRRTQPGRLRRRLLAPSCRAQGCTPAR